MLEFAEIRHLDGMKGNFEVADEKEYVAVATLHKSQPLPQLIFSNVPEIVQQQQFVFDSFWNRAMPAQQKISELEKGIVAPITNIFTDYKEAEKKEFEMIRKAEEKIEIIYSTASAFHLQEKGGVLELLKERANQQKSLQIKILVPLDSSIKKSLSLKLLTNSENSNIQIQNIEPSIAIKIKSLVVDTKESLIMEIKELGGHKSDTVIGFTIYSNSLPTVSTYSSIFEVILNQSILAQELRHTGEIKDDFINIAAHELRTPTQAIAGYSELNDELLDQLVNKRESLTREEQMNIMLLLNKHQENISRNALRLNELINNLLDVARFDSNHNNKVTLDKEKIDLVNEINDIVKLEFGQRIREKNLKISFINNNLGEHIWVYADKSRLNQILSNLIDNAIKFSKKDDNINIMIKDNSNFRSNTNNAKTNESIFVTNSNRSNDLIKKKDDNQSNVKHRENDEEENFVYIGISDQGKGISPNILPRLFEKFATDSDFGTGLGLFISKKLVGAHGGRIWAFNNADGIGSTFCIWSTQIK
jgi:signal transduction histidine kinase